MILFIFVTVSFYEFLNLLGWKNVKSGMRFLEFLVRPVKFFKRFQLIGGNVSSRYLLLNLLAFNKLSKDIFSAKFFMPIKRGVKKMEQKTPKPISFFPSLHCKFDDNETLKIKH